MSNWKPEVKVNARTFLVALVAVIIVGFILSARSHHCIATVIYASGVDDCGNEHPWHGQE